MAEKRAYRTSGSDYPTPRLPAEICDFALPARDRLNQIGYKSANPQQLSDAVLRPKTGLARGERAGEQDTRPHGMTASSEADIGTHVPTAELCYDARVPRPQLPPRREFSAARFVESLDTAWKRRAPIFANGEVTAYRLLDGPGDGVPGIYLDRYGPAAVMNVYEDAHLLKTSVTAAAQLTLEMLAPAGLEAVYVKPFARDRSRLGGQTPDESLAATPCAGRRQPEALTVHEYESQFEVRLYDGHSTGLFLDHREHRRALSQRKPSRVLNLFAYTCAFAVPLAAVGAQVTNVDVSARYLEWGRRNLALNGGAPAAARFFRMDAFEYLTYATKRSEERFDLVILDPPTFAAGNSRRGVKPWKALEDYPSLVQAALSVLAPGGLVFAASNTRELAGTGALARLITKALGAAPAWQPLPPWPVDVRESGRVAAVFFEP